MNNTAKKVDTGIKDILAKLMATENISIEHRSDIHTAAFDIKNRVLILPTWKEMDDHLYNMLIGHEVGHALHTPQDYIVEGKDNARFRGYLNVIEDARIEKIIKKSFPGIRRSFRDAYQQLDKKDFFGVQKKGIENFDLIDRINIHFKLDSYVFDKVPFTDEERVYVDKVDNCKSFDDVVAVAKEIFEYQKEKNEEQQQQEQDGQGDEQGQGDGQKQKVKVKISKNAPEGGEKFDPEKHEIESVEYDDSEDESEDGEGEGDSEENQGEGDIEAPAQSGESDKSESGEDSESDSEGNESSSQSTPDAKHEDPQSETDKNFQENLQQLIDQNAGRYAYLDFPKFTKEDLAKWIVPYKTVHKQIREHYNKRYTDLERHYNQYNYTDTIPNEIADAEKRLVEFKQDSVKVVNYLVKEFEMKKAAFVHARTLTAKTGVINTNKLHAYKYTEDIFKRSSTIPEGKNHGLIVFFDMSGSMSEHMAGTIEQMINLALFCRKVQIPFEVYGFTSQSINDNYDRYGRIRGNGSKGKKPARELILEQNFSLRNYFSHRMNSGEFESALVNMMAILQYHEAEYRSGFSLPNTEYLGSTPLDESIILATEIVKQMKEKYGLQIINTVFITDGDSTSGFEFYNDEGYLERIHSFSKVYINKGNKRYELDARKSYDFTKVYLRILKETCGTNNIGFFITRLNKSNIPYVVNRRINTDSIPYEKLQNLYEDYHKRAKSDGFISFDTDGYDEYFVIPGGKALRTKKKEYTVKPGASKRKISSTFKKNQSGQISSRVMLSRFIKLIAE